MEMNLKAMRVFTRNWIDSAHRNYWRALMNATLKIRVTFAMELVSFNCIQ